MYKIPRILGLFFICQWIHVNYYQNYCYCNKCNNKCNCYNILSPYCPSLLPITLGYGLCTSSHISIDYYSICQYVLKCFFFIPSDIGVWRLCVWERKTRSTVLMRRERLHPLTKRKGGRGRAKSSPASGKWFTEKPKAKMRSRWSRRIRFSVCLSLFFFFKMNTAQDTDFALICVDYVYNTQWEGLNWCVHFKIRNNKLWSVELNSKATAMQFM